MFNIYVNRICDLDLLESYTINPKCMHNTVATVSDNLAWIKLCCT